LRASSAALTPESACQKISIGDLGIFFSTRAERPGAALGVAKYPSSSLRKFRGSWTVRVFYPITRAEISQFGWEESTPQYLKYSLSKLPERTGGDSSFAHLTALEKAHRLSAHVEEQKKDHRIT
jgi:hypothetical protein